MIWGHAHWHYNALSTINTCMPWMWHHAKKSYFRECHAHACTLPICLPGLFFLPVRPLTEKRLPFFSPQRRRNSLFVQHVGTATMRDNTATRGRGKYIFSESVGGLFLVRGRTHEKTKAEPRGPGPSQAAPSLSEISAYGHATKKY